MNDRDPMDAAMWIIDKLFCWPFLLLSKLRNKSLRWILMIPAFSCFILSMAIFGMPFLLAVIGGAFYEIVNEKYE